MLTVILKIAGTEARRLMKVIEHGVEVGVKVIPW